MPNPKNIITGLSKLAQEFKATEQGAQKLKDLKEMIKPAKGVWQGKEPLDIWQARQLEAELEAKKKKLVKSKEKSLGASHIKEGLPSSSKNNLGPAFGAYGYTDDLLRRERGSFASNFGVDYGQALTPSFEFVPVSKLNSSEKVTDDRVRSLMNAMEESGNSLDNKIPPIIVDSSGNVIDGHHRLEAARRLGYEQVPVIEKFDIQSGPKLGDEYAKGGNVRHFQVGGMATGGKTRAGTKAEPFPWEEALEAQLGRTKKRLKGLATDPVQEGVNIVRQYLHDPTLSPEENERKLEEFMFGFVGSTNLPKPALQKASEVFGKQEGKTAMYTQADRTKVGGGFLGGPGFSGLQLELPAYKEAEAAWGVAHPAVAKTIVGSNKRVPEGQAIWAPMLGHPEQHRSNQMVFDQIFNQFRREAKKGNLDKELHQKINDRLASAVDKEGKPLFPPDVDIMNKNFRQLANTFDRRAVAADVMAGKGVGGRKGSIIDYPKIIESTTDPAVIDAPSGSVGHRAFTLTGDVGFHPELHPAFPYILRGEDIGQTYTPIPKELAFMDFIEKVRKEKGRDPGYMDFTRGYAPQQFISEDWLTNLQKHGFAKGGLAMADGGQAFPLQEDFQTEMERRRARPRTRAGVPVEDTNVLGGALRGLANTLGGLAFGRTVGTLGMPADILEPTAAPGAMIPMFGMAGMPSEISKALVQRFAPKGPDIPAPTSEYLLEKGLEKFKPPQEFEVSAKLGRFLPFDITEMQAAGRKLKALQPTFTEMMQTGLERATEPTRSYVIKPEGGNWLNKTIESYLQPLRWEGPHAPETFPGFNEEGKQQAIAVNNFVDKKLAKYMRNEMGTMSDPVRLQADQWAETKAKLLADKQKQIDKARADMEKARRERNVEPEVLTRSQARIRELEKEKALIENRKGLHYEPRGTSFAGAQRRVAGYPEMGEAKTEIATRWEDISDKAIRGGTYREHIPLVENDIYASLQSKTPEEQAAVIRQMNQQSLESMGGKFAVENPEAMAYKVDKSLPPYELGFDHLMDELQNAMDAGSGLPKELLISPKTLDKMSVPQAIEHVDKINAWRASQKAEADAARAANQATVVHKEYPEAGLKWVEIKAPDTSTIELPEGVTRTQSSVTQGGLDVPGIGFVQAKWNPETGLDWAEAEEKAKRLLASKPVEDALKYEGEMLKHCVGGYCFDVMEGRSRIFSLRDEAGRPHATIEVEPDARIGFRQGEGPKTASEDYELRQEWARGVDSGKISENTTFAEWWRSQNNIPEPVRGERIAQIKGESNRAPSKEVEPYVQDFVKSGQWSHVGDISNAGLMQSKNAPWRQRFEEAGIDVPEYFSEKDYQDLVKQYFEKTSTPMDPKFMYETYGIQMTPEGGAPNMADGGAVHPAVEKFAASLPHPAVTEFVAKLADGGGVWKTMVDGKYNTVPDVNDAERVIQGPAFAEGGGVWKQLVEGAGNA